MSPLRKAALGAGRSGLTEPAGAGTSEARGGGLSLNTGNIPQSFTPAMHAELKADGTPLRVTERRNVPGFSEAYWCIDNDGDSAFVSVNEVRIIDPNYLPTQLPRK